MGVGFRVRVQAWAYECRVSGFGCDDQETREKVVIGVLTNANEVILSWVLVEKLYLSYHNRDL